MARRSSTAPSSRDIDRDVVRLARRDWERARRVPEDLAVEVARASADGQERWQQARAADDFAAFAPALERNVELARRRAECLAQDGQSHYEALLSDYDHALSAQDVRAGVRRPRRGARPARRARRANTRRACACRCPSPPSRRPWTAPSRGSGSSRRAGAWTSRRTPSRPGSGTGDTRITTRYSDGDVESLLSSLHEYGHALYERQVDPALLRTNLAGGTSMSIHESQSKLWENHVARSPAFAGVLAGELGQERLPDHRRGPARGARRASSRRPIRVSADP